MNDRLNHICDILARNELPLTWRTIIGDPPRAQSPDYDDARWGEGWRSLTGKRWDTAWFRAQLPACPLIAGEVLASAIPGGMLSVWVDGTEVAQGFEPVFTLPQHSARRSTVIAVQSRMGELASEHEHLILWQSERLQQIQRARRSLEFVRQWREAQPHHAARIDPVLERYAAAVDPGVYEGAPSVFWHDVQAATELLGELDDLAKQYELHIVPHSHVDLAWGWTYAETKRISGALFDTALRLMEEDGEYTFTQDQPPMYEPHAGSAMEAAIRARMDEGRWDISGGTYSEPESFMPGGESWVRQFLYTKRWFSERFGRDIGVHWAPDNFSGHANTLPQIWRKCGIRCFAFGNWYQADHSGQFLWEGLDGTRVYAHYFTGHYDSAQMLDQDKTIRNLTQHMAYPALHRYMLLDGDDLTPPWSGSPDGVRRLRQLAAFPTVSFSTPHRFFDGVDPGDPQSVNTELRVVTGEFISTARNRHNNVGAYTTFAEVKRRNRQLEWMLRSAEAMAALAIRAGFEYPADRFERAWKGVLLNQMHDILPGTAIHEAYAEAHRRYDEAEQTCIDVIEHAANAVSRGIGTRGEGIPVVLFNTLGAPRSDAAEVLITEAQSYTQGFEAVDAAGNTVPAQVIDANTGIFDKTNKTYRVLVQPDSVPAMGWNTVWLRPAPVQPELFSASMAGPDGLTLDNDFVRVRIDRHTGWVAEFIDKRLGRNIIPDGQYACALEMQRDMGNPWHLAPEGPAWSVNETVRTEVVEDGDVRAAIRVTTEWHRTVCVQEYRLYRNSPKLEVLCKVDLHEPDVVLKALVPTTLPGDAVWSCEVPWGVVERPLPDNDRASQTWVDLSGTDASGAPWGVALLNNGRYGHSLREGGTMTLTLVRSVVAHKSHDQTDEGMQEVMYAIVPHEGTWREAGIAQMGHMLNAPIVAHRDILHDGADSAAASRISVEPENIALAAVKRAEDGDGIIVHLYETFGQETAGTITFDGAYSDIAEVDLIERETGDPVHTDGMTIRRDFRPWEIVAFRVRE